MAAQSKVWVCSLLFVETAGSNPAGGMFVSDKCLCCQVEVSASG